MHRLTWCLAGLLLALATGCRTPPPNVRPPEPPQTLNLPPDLAKYETPDWPKWAMEDPNPRNHNNKNLFEQAGASGTTNVGGFNNQASPSSYNK